MIAAPDLFETHRRFLARLAYRMLGSVADAEDIVQDALLRWHEVEPRGSPRRAPTSHASSRGCASIG